MILTCFVQQNNLHKWTHFLWIFKQLAEVKGYKLDRSRITSSSPSFSFQQLFQSLFKNIFHESLRYNSLQECGFKHKEAVKASE